MAAGVNKVILIGNLGKRPELRHTGSGMAVTELRLATTERRKDRDGNWGDKTEWHSVVVWGRTAENCAQYLDAGRQVYVEGRLQTRDWQDDQGNKRYKTEVVANTVQFLSGGGGGGGGGGYGGGGGGGGGGYGGGGGGGRSDSPAPGMDSGPQPDSPFTDDIPF